MCVLLMARHRLEVPKVNSVAHVAKAALHDFPTPHRVRLQSQCGNKFDMYVCTWYRLNEYLKHILVVPSTVYKR